MKKIVLAVFVFLFLIPGQTQAALVPCGGQGQSACQFCHIFLLIANIINFILIYLAPIVGGLMLIIGGLYLLTAGANPSTLGKAKSVITAAIIGIVIIFIAWIFLNTLLTYMGIEEWTGFMDNPNTLQVEGWWEFTDKCPVN